jgi:hypothetical protein
VLLLSVVDDDEDARPQEVEAGPLPMLGQGASAVAGPKGVIRCRRIYNFLCSMLV